MTRVTTNQSRSAPSESAQSNSAGSIDIAVEKLVYGGDGLARVDGQVLLVPYVLPGERVVVSPERVKTGLLRGLASQVMEASPHRVNPRCEYFGHCGGCQYQHAEYGFQLEQKREILRETLQRLGGIRYEADIPILSADPWNYRNRIQLHFVRGEAGFHKAASHELCAIDHCHIASPLLVEVIGKLQGAAKAPQWPDFLRSLEIFTNETDVQFTIIDSIKPVAARFFEWCATFIPSLAAGPVDYSAAGHSYRISRGSFFQVNRFLTDVLVEEVIGDGQGERAVDLYAGVGLFSLPLAERFASVEAVERGGPAYRDLEWNASQSGANIRPLKATAEDFLRSVKDSPDCIVADPPRAGLGKEATAELLRIQAPQLKLVSCDPSTLARDAKKLLEAYRIERLTLVDLFPQTYHFEVVAHLRLDSNVTEPPLSE
jgi:23S rRNA (uracil1939-C5)-methyltransferase